MARIVLKYIPRKQFVAFHGRKQRFSCLVAHRRAGKTVAAVNELVVRALHTKKNNARYGYIAPYRKQAKDIAWVYLKEATEGFAVSVRESDLRVELPNGSWISIYGADNIDALRGLYFMGIVIDEFGDCRAGLWAEVIMPTLIDYGGWAVVMGTPKGKNTFFKFHELSKIDENWFSLTIKASESGIIPKYELELMRSVMTDAQFQQEMECSFSAPVVGTFYAEIIQDLERNGQIAAGAAKYDPAFPVSCVADLGFKDSTAFWFWQARPEGISIIKYYENQGKKLDFYFGFLDDTGYEFDKIWLPHDAKAATLQTGRSTIEQFVSHFRDRGVQVGMVPKLSKLHGIEAARMILSNCWFDLNECSYGIEALRGYRRKYDSEKQVYSNEPLHSWESDGADSFRYLSLVCDDVICRDAESLSAERDGFSLPSLGTLDQMFEARDSFLSRKRGRI